MDISSCFNCANACNCDTPTQYKFTANIWCEKYSVRRNGICNGSKCSVYDTNKCCGDCIDVKTCKSESLCEAIVEKTITVGKHYSCNDYVDQEDE